MVETLPDGRRRYRMRQSWLKTLGMCGERSRLEWVGEMPREESDGTIGGTAVHAGIEDSLRVIIDGGDPPPVQFGLDAYDRAFDLELANAEEHGVPVRWHKGQETTTRRKYARCFEVWHEKVLPRLDPIAVEIDFGPLVFHEDDRRVIEINGQIDYLDRRGLMDWKTSGRAYEAWEKRRFDLQSTLYGFAAQALDLIPPGPFEFTFGVLIPRAQSAVVQKVVVERDESHFAWLRLQALAACELIDAELPVWPLNDDGWHCSPKWCGNWSKCKGAALSEPALSVF